MPPIYDQLALLWAAQTGAPAGPMGGCAGGDSLASMGPIFLMMGIFYFVVIGPARKERKLHQAMLDALKRGDEVITNGGIIGTVVDMDAKILTLEVSRGVRIKVLRSAISKKNVETQKTEAKADERPA